MLSANEQNVKTTPASEAVAVPCRYCFNLDHYVPVGAITRKVDCRICSICTTYAPVTEWEQHGGDEAKAVISCEVCPVCDGFIPETEKTVMCRYCTKCQSYVTAKLWRTHQWYSCYEASDPFTEELK